jgi:hypothetical protein
MNECLSPVVNDTGDKLCTSVSDTGNKFIIGVPDINPCYGDLSQHKLANFIGGSVDVGCLRSPFISHAIKPLTKTREL